MRLSCLPLAAVAAASLALTLAPAVAWAQDVDFSGDWTTSYGAMHLTQDGDGVRGGYETDNGRLRGHVDGRTLTGVWTEDTADQYCDEARMGSHYWGRIQFRISRDGSEFHGRWGYCDAEPSTDWTGHR